MYCTLNIIHRRRIQNDKKKNHPFHSVNLTPCQLTNLLDLLLFLDTINFHNTKNNELY